MNGGQHNVRVSLLWSRLSFTTNERRVTLLALQRDAILQETATLPDDQAIPALAEALLQPRGPIPAVAEDDALHIASAAFYSCQYLLTWNFRHIANAHIRRRVDNILRSLGYEPPIICTADELTGPHV